MTLVHKMNVPFHPLKISEDDIAEVVKVLRTGWIGTGPRVQEFERALCGYLGAKHVVATNSGTAALHLSLLALGVGPGDEVITTPMTFASTANVIVHVGAKPVFADSKESDWNIDPMEVKRRITKRTKAIIPVHLAGMPCDLAELEDVARSANAKLIEDAAHAIGAKYRGRMIGASGNIVCFSFYPSKNITTIEGGAIATPDREAAELVSVLRLHGQSSDAWRRYSSGSARSYRVIHAGFKYNMTDVEAALGTSQLEKIGRFLRAREKIARVYNEELADAPGLVLPPGDTDGKERVWHLYSVLIKSEELRVSRDQVVKRLNDRGVGTGIHYEAVHLQPFYRRKFGLHEGMYPAAEYVSSRTLSLPLSATVSEEQALYVSDCLKSVLKRR